MSDSDVKKIVLRPIDRKEADALVKRVHYSGKVVNNSQIHIGIFWNGKLEGAMQFGPSLDKSKLVGLVQGTGWNEFIELNRMAFSDVLPRNSESRAIAIAMKILKKHAPHLKWVVSFADGTQCGDGTIYRASGFVLTGINSNTYMIRMPNGEVIHRITFGDKGSEVAKKYAPVLNGKCSGISELLRVTGGTQLKGFQLRYIYFLDPTARQRLTVPILPFSEIERLHAGMYKGQTVSRAVSIEGDATSNPTSKGSFNTTTVLQLTSDVEEEAHVE